MKEYTKIQWVDAGNISVVNIDNLKKYNPDFSLNNNNKKIFDIIDLKSGEYKIKIGDKYYIMEIEEDGQYYIGDLCYCFVSDKRWENLLKDTNYLEDANFFVKILDDGDYFVKIKKID